MRVYHISMSLYFSLLLCGYVYFGATSHHWSAWYWFDLVWAEICIVMIALNLSREFKAKA